MQYKEIVIELSNNCNLSCKMCGFGVHANPPSPHRFMTKDLFDRILSEVNGNTAKIRLNGRGESTLHPDFIDLVCKARAALPDSQINLFSNLSFNGDRILSALIDNDVQMFVSLDAVNGDILRSIRIGAREGLIKSNLSKLRKAKSRPFLVMTLQPDNIGEIVPMAEFAVENNCGLIYNVIRSDRQEDELAFSKFFANNKERLSNDLVKARELLEERGHRCLVPDQIKGVQMDIPNATRSSGNCKTCPVLGREACILYNGDVLPCNMFNPYVLGNLKENSLAEILESWKFSAFKRNHKGHYYCRSCANMGV